MPFPNNTPSLAVVKHLLVVLVSHFHCRIQLCLDGVNTPNLVCLPFVTVKLLDSYLLC